MKSSLPPWVDIFNHDFLQVEKQVEERAGSYKGLSPEALLTSAEDFQSIFNHLPEVQTWIELGSGHGLGPLLFSYLFPDKTSIGIEFEKSRHAKALQMKKSLRLKNVTFLHQDLLHSEIPVGDTYFLYFPCGIILDRILFTLAQNGRSWRLVVIESHGDLIPRLNKEHAWLSITHRIPLQGRRHHPEAMVYEKIATKKFSWLDFSFQEKLLLIQDHDGRQWVGDSFGMEWLKDELLQLHSPPRTIAESAIRGILELSELDSRLQELILVRRRNEAVQGHFIRKVFISPEIRIELSNGRLLCLQDLNRVTIIP